jgi:CheY-like chemotaxis protein
VTDGAQAVQAASETDYDLVLMDVQMPVMDGHAATRAIRAAGLGSLPIIALTANAFPEDAKLCREAGMSDFLAKPLRKQTLVDAMLRALGPARGPSEPSLEVAPTLVPDAGHESMAGRQEHDVRPAS